jgi:cytoskeletal protein CcmA (bactofilin family)
MMATNSGLVRFFSQKQIKGSDVTFIGVDAQLQGEIQLKGDALIAGRIQGVLSSTSHVKVELSGVLEGDIYCKELKVCGLVKGRIFCDKLIIVSSGVVDGELACQQMEIYHGGQFIGTRTSMSQKETVQEAAEATGMDNSQILEDALLAIVQEAKEIQPKLSETGQSNLNLAS